MNGHERESRIGLTFHRTFSLNTPSISKILNLSYKVDGQIKTVREIEESTGLGSVYVNAMPQYARACGLMEMGGYRLTPFGELVCRQDLHLMHQDTLWLMHYHLSAPHGPGPAFWTHLVTKFLPFGKDVCGADVAQEIARFQESQAHNVNVKDRAVRSTATVFLGTYTKSDGLGRLGLIKTVSGRSGFVRVSESQSAPVDVVAVALADYWAAHFGEQITVSLDELARDDGFARVMWMSNRQLDEVLMSLKRENIVDLYRVAPPYQVVRRWSNNDELLARLYE